MVYSNMNPKSLVKYLWYSFFGCLVLFVLFFAGVSIGMLGPIPSFEQLENPRTNLASEIYSADGVLLGKYYIENRTNAEFHELPNHLVQALLATEDIRYYKHSGVDVRGVIRAIYGLLTGQQKGGASTITQQLAKNLFDRPKNITKLQLISIKLREWITAIKLERNYSKEEIIAMYLNTVDFGSHAFGINSAAQTYFGKMTAHLKIEEAATLIGMLKAPTKFSPVRNPQLALQRRNVVLSQMLKYKFITQEIFDSLKNIPINLEKYQIQDHTAGIAPYFREYLRMLMTAKKPVESNFATRQQYLDVLDQWENNLLYGWCEKNRKPDGSTYNIYKDGLKIYTTIDSRMQRYAEEALIEHVKSNLQPAFYREWKGVKNAPWDPKMTKKDIQKTIDILIRRTPRYISMKRQRINEEDILKSFQEPVPMRVFSWKGEIDTVMTPYDSLLYYLWFLQAGFVAIDPHTGHVKAYVGGINFNYFKFDHATQARRQVGSTFKPFVYAVAVRDLRLSPCTELPCVPITIDLPNGDKWSPANSGKVPEGEMVSLRKALALSINWISARLISFISPEEVVRLARNMGIRSHMLPVYSIALGVPELTLMEMVAAQTTYPAKGIYTAPLIVTRIEDNTGNTIQVFLPKKNEAMDEETAWVMLEMMKGVVLEGTAARLRSVYKIPYPIAGKTGTTDNNSDGWFMGITPDLVAGAWVGGQIMQVHFRSTALGQGANTALPIWAKFMLKVYADPNLKISKDDFYKPTKPVSIETDCSNYKTPHNLQIVFESNKLGFE